MFEEAKIIEIQELYDNVFDADGNILACGRETCKELIHALHKMFPDVDFGDEATGWMQVKTIQQYVIGK